MNNTFFGLVAEKTVFFRQSQIMAGYEDNMLRGPARPPLRTDCQRSEDRILGDKMIPVHGVDHGCPHSSQRAKKRRPATVRVNDIRSDVIRYLRNSDWNPRIDPAPEELDPEGWNTQMRSLGEQVGILLGEKTEIISVLESGKYLQRMSGSAARVTVSDDL